MSTSTDHLISEDFFLLLLDDSGNFVRRHTVTHSYGMAAAAVADAVRAGVVTLAAERNPRVLSTTDSPPLSVIARPVQRLRQKSGRRLRSTITDPRVDPTVEVAAALAAQGIIEVRTRTWLFFRVRSYPIVNRAAVDALRSRLAEVIQGATPSAHDQMVLALLTGLGVGGAVFPGLQQALGRRAFSARLKHISADIPEGDAVARAQQELTAALMAGVIAAGAVSASS